MVTNHLATLTLIVSFFVGYFYANKNEETRLIGLEWRFKLHSVMPIKNASNLKSLSSFSFVDVKDIASIITSETKEQVTFSQAIRSWSRETFLPAECFIPLCRTSPEILTWQENTQDQFFPTGNADLEACCAIADTRLPETEEEEEEECIVNPLQSCRYQPYEAPCGDLVEDENGRLLMDEAACNPTAAMEIDARFFELENSEICCLQCGCFGDPRCVSFDGTSDIWVLCDGRGPKNDQDPDSRCLIQQDVCLEQFDHEDRRCQWIDLTPEEEENWSILTNGSQCIPNDLSGESWIVMYEFDEFGLEVRQINRGVIDAVELRLDDDVFSMEADDCDLAGFNNSWRLGSDFISPPESFKQVILEIDERYQEVVWAISQTSTAMHVRLRCLRQRDNAGNESPPRIHIEALVEPEANLEGRQNTNGFCINNEFDQAGSTENTELIESGQGCTAADISKLEQVEIARALCGESIMYGNIATCLVSFCEENFFPSFIDAMDCVVSFGDGVEGFEFRDTFCKAMTFTKSDAEDCQDKWDSIGAVETINIYYLNSNPPDLEDTCGESIGDFPVELGDCEAGVSLQYLNSELEWTNFLSIPERRPPCGNLLFNIVDHEEIFLNPIRWKQCTVPSDCITATNTLCRTQTRFASDILLLPFREIRDEPSAKPTESPTLLPTTEPTLEPTLFPSVTPTSSPTEFPSEITDSFTLFPSVSPTSEPTLKPTASIPTNFPTEFPTEDEFLETDFPSESPTVNPFTESPTNENPCSRCDKDMPTISPTSFPSLKPSTSPTSFPSLNPTISPTNSPTNFPTALPTDFPTEFPTNEPTTTIPTESPTVSPTLNPSMNPTESPTLHPTTSPSLFPTANPTSFPTGNPTESPTLHPTTSPTEFPTAAPTDFPTASPTSNPSVSPTQLPTSSPTRNPSATPSETPTESPTLVPTPLPTDSPTPFPSESPTESPTQFPTLNPTCNPTSFPSVSPTELPTVSPVPFPTESPTLSPSEFPTGKPTETPTPNPTESPTENPTESPTSSPTVKVISEDDCECNSFLVEGVRAHKMLEKRASVSHKIKNEKKLELQEAGEIVFYAMYKSEDDAERELFVSDAVQTLSKINEQLDYFDVVAANCEVSLLISTVDQQNTEKDSIFPDGVTDIWNFFDLESNYVSIFALVGLSVAVLTLAIGICFILTRTTKKTPIEIMDYLTEEI